jgi:hypothetical protein
LFVGRVTVTLEPELPSPVLKPLVFDASGEAKLREWNVQWDSGSKPTFSRRTGELGGALEIQAHGDALGASWRTCPLLEGGSYQFIGRVRTSGVDANTPANCEVALRALGRGAAKSVNAATGGAELSYDFTMSTPGYVELVCEFIGSEGSARFDLDSLKLVRKK